MERARSNGPNLFLFGNNKIWWTKKSLNGTESNRLNRLNEYLNSISAASHILKVIIHITFKFWICLCINVRPNFDRYTLIMDKNHITCVSFHQMCLMHITLPMRPVRVFSHKCKQEFFLCQMSFFYTNILTPINTNMIKIKICVQYIQ